MASSAPSTNETPLVSIICPVFNEALFQPARGVVRPLGDRYRFELIFTNNGSTDRSVARILEIREKHPWVQLITLSRNFGYHASLMSGLVNAMGDVLVIIDVDCEDPPELNGLSGDHSVFVKSSGTAMNQSPSVVATTAVGASSRTSSTTKRAASKKALAGNRVLSLEDSLQPPAQSSFPAFTRSLHARRPNVDPAAGRVCALRGVDEALHPVSIGHAGRRGAAALAGVHEAAHQARHRADARVRALIRVRLLNWNCVQRIFAPAPKPELKAAKIIGARVRQDERPLLAIEFDAMTGTEE
jgi:Glycosyl transferase family 2